MYFRYNNRIRDAQGRRVVDILRSFKFVEKVKSNTAYYAREVVRDGETIEDVAYRIYGDPLYHIVIILMNDIVDPYYDWILSEQELMDYVKRKYGAENVYAIHHYETTESSELGEGEIVESDAPFSVSISNFQYEDILNEEKREILILKPQYLDQFEQEIQQAFSKSSLFR